MEADDDVAVRNVAGQHLVNEVGRPIVHLPPCAGRTEQPRFADEGQYRLVAAPLAGEPREARGGNTAGKVGAKGALDEAWKPLASLVLRRLEEILQVLPYSSMESSLLGLSALVLLGPRAANLSPWTLVQLRLSPPRRHHALPRRPRETLPRGSDRSGNLGAD